MTAKHFFRMMNKTEGELETEERRFGLEDFDSRLADIGVQLKNMQDNKRTWVSVKDITTDG